MAHILAVTVAIGTCLAVSLVQVAAILAALGSTMIRRVVLLFLCTRLRSTRIVLGATRLGSHFDICVPFSVPDCGSLKQFPLSSLTWKEQLVKTYTTVPKSFQELVWRLTLLSFAVSAGIVGISVWKNPTAIFGKPVAEQSLIERFAGNKGLRQQVYGLMSDFFIAVRPKGLMLVSWEDLDSFVGVWVRPADKFPGKSGPHGLSQDLRVLGGPFLFGECSYTDSIAMPGYTMVACPVNSEYDAWGYVAAIVEPSEVEETQRLLGFLAHRVTELVY